MALSWQLMTTGVFENGGRPAGHEAEIWQTDPGGCPPARAADRGSGHPKVCLACRVCIQARPGTRGIGGLRRRSSLWQADVGVRGGD